MNPPVTAQARHDDVGPAGEKAGTPATPETRGIVTVAPSVPDYELLRRIGHGAYGDVWLVRNKATGVLRAAKIVWRRSFEDDRPFQREFEGICRFESISREHPSQLALFHIGRNEPAGYFYYVMELADDASASGSSSLPTRDKGKEINQPAFGELEVQLQTYKPHTLRADLEQGRLPAARVLEISLALTEALRHLHSKGLVHRDVKPSNVIFVNRRPKLADIGLVTDASDQCSIVGTEGYLPPEGPGTPQADIFALGKVLYEAATGLDRREFPKLPDGLRSWPDAKQVFELNEIVLKACAKEPAERYPTCQETHDELALLQRGKSVIRKRGIQWYWATGKKAALAFSIVAAVAALISLWPRFPAGRSEPSNDGPDSTNLEANALCDKGMYILRGDNSAAFLEAYTNFNEAIARDPNFARPYVGLLELQLRESVPGLPTFTRDRLRATARHLEQLAPHLAATYCAESIINWSDWHYPEAEHFALEAIKSNPKYELGHTWYGFMLFDWGWPEAGRKQLEISRALAPSKVTTYRGLGQTYYVERDYTNAIKWYQEAIRWEPHHAFAYELIGQAFEATGEYSNALVYLEKSDVLNGEEEAGVKRRYDALRRALDAGGIPAYWQQQWTWTENKTNTDFYWKAVVQIHLGNTNSAVAWLQRSYEAHERRGDSLEYPLQTLLYDEYWDGLHDDPRFKRLLDGIGFTKVMPPRTR